MSRGIFPILGLLALSSVVTLFPAADPPAGLSWSRAPFSDEGLKTYNARNFVFTGHWKFNDHDTYPGWHLRSPLFVSLVTTSFNCFGVGLAQARLVGMFFGLLLPVVLTLLLWQAGQRAEALVAWLFLASCNFYVMYARLCLFDIALAAFMTLSLCGLAASFRRNPTESSETPRARGGAQIALSLMAFVFAFLVKPIVLVLLPTLLIGLGMKLRRDGVPLKRILVPVAVVLGAVLMLAVLAVMRWDGAAGYIAGRLGCDSLKGLGASAAGVLLDVEPSGMVRIAEFWRQTPTLALLALPGLILVLKTWKDRSPAARLLVIWLANYLVFLAVINYKPNRYFLPLLPVLAALAATFVVASFRWIAAAKRPWRPIAMAAACGVLALHAGFNGLAYFKWASNRSYAMIDASRALDSAIAEPDAVIEGFWAAPLVLETRLRCYLTIHGANSTPEQFARYRPTYAVVEKEVESDRAAAEKYLAMHGSVLDQVEAVRTCRLGRYELVLLRLHWKAGRPLAASR